MDDPNVTYKRAFAELSEELGRNPTSNELLGLHDAYKRAWGPAEETQTGGGESTRLGGVYAKLPATPAPLSAPVIIPTREEPVSAPKPPENKPGAADGLIVGSRGPAGGIMATCRRCRSLFERPTRAGRPPVVCGECRP